MRASRTKTPKPETSKPEIPKPETSRNPKFCFESLVAPRSLSFDHGPWTHGLGTKKTGGYHPKITEPSRTRKICEVETFSYSRWFMIVVV
jgi:hypothetical protein